MEVLEERLADVLESYGYWEETSGDASGNGPLSIARNVRLENINHKPSREEKLREQRKRRLLSTSLHVPDEERSWRGGKVRVCYMRWSDCPGRYEPPVESLALSGIAELGYVVDEEFSTGRIDIQILRKDTQGLEVSVAHTGNATGAEQGFIQASSDCGSLDDFIGRMANYLEAKQC